MVRALEPVSINHEKALTYIEAIRRLCAEVGMEKFARPHPIRDLLDDLEKPFMQEISKLET